MGSQVKIDLITCDPKNEEYALILIEDGPWLKDDEGWNQCLKRIQNRVFDAFDVAVDGHLYKLYPDSEGKSIRIQIDSHNGAPPQLKDLVMKIRKHFGSNDEYLEAIKTSKYIRKVRVVMGEEMGRPKG